METFTVEGQTRDTRGKNAARRTRMTGMVPATLYGARKEAVALSVNAKQIARILRSETGHNTIFTVTVAGGAQEKAMLKDWQVDPLKGVLLHVDLLRIAMDVRMRVRVPVRTFGEPQGVKQQGGILEFIRREIEIECLPADIPEHVEVDVSELMLHQGVRVRDLQSSGKWKPVTEPDTMIVHVVALKAEEPAPAEAAAAPAVAAAEPEVIKKGKKEEEEK